MTDFFFVQKFLVTKSREHSVGEDRAKYKDIT